MAHVAGNGAGNWTRTYAYNETSLLEPAQKSNRLSQTALQTGANPPAEPYTYDAHGNMVQMPHLPLMQWDFKDRAERDLAAGGECRHCRDDLLRL